MQRVYALVETVTAFPLWLFFGSFLFLYKYPSSAASDWLLILPHFFNLLRESIDFFPKILSSFTCCFLELLEAIPFERDRPGCLSSLSQCTFGITKGSQDPMPSFNPLKNLKGFHSKNKRRDTGLVAWIVQASKS